MMTPEEFREQYASERGYEDWYELWNKDRTRDLEGEIMKAYALHVLERVDKEAEGLSGHVTYPDGSTERYISSYNLKQIFEERKKELNGETETRQTYPCKVCGKPFGDKLSLYNHYDEEHNRE